MEIKDLEKELKKYFNFPNIHYFKIYMDKQGCETKVKCNGTKDVIKSIARDLEGCVRGIEEKMKGK